MPSSPPPPPTTPHAQAPARLLARRRRSGHRIAGRPAGGSHSSDTPRALLLGRAHRTAQPLPFSHVARFGASGALLAHHPVRDVRGYHGPGSVTCDPGLPGQTVRIRPPHGGTREPEEDAVKVVVDFDLCQSNALCMGLAPEVFEVRDDGFLYILDEHPAEALREKVEEAVRTCPTQAISIEED